MNFKLISQEFHRLWRHSFDIMIAQGLGALMIFLFAFLQQENLTSIPLLGLHFYWISQGFCLIFLSDRLYKTDCQTGFYRAVLISQTSMGWFLSLRWIIFVVTLSGWSFLLSFPFLSLLKVSMDLRQNLLILLFLFNGSVTAYGGVLALLSPHSKSPLLSFLLLPLLVPLFIFSIAGCSAENFSVSVPILAGHLFLSLPLLLSGAFILIKRTIINNS